jgi:hypothetical protein
MSGQPTIAPLVIQQGRTFRKIARWESQRFMTAAIQAMTQAGIVQITTQAPHGIPDGWRVAVVDAKGMTELNAKNNPPKGRDFHEAVVVGPSAIELNEISSASFRPYSSSGYLKWYAPHDLTGYTARMAIKDRVGGTVLLTLTTENGGITVDDAEKLIELFISDDETALVAWADAVYDLEVVAPSGDVTCLFTGPVSVTKEITT